jgi:hypothetical protein
MAPIAPAATPTQRPICEPLSTAKAQRINTTARIRPSVVVFVFTGNPGLSGPTAGCADANSPYDLSQLRTSYENSLVPMADMAAGAGAVVYFEAPPPRNPATSVGYDPQKNENRGFQRSPPIVSFYESLATKDPLIGTTTTAQPWQCQRPTCHGC